MPSRRAPLITCLAVLATATAQAGRPLQTEDAGVIDAQGCELEGGHGRWQQPGASHRQRSLQLGCGLGSGSEVALQAIDPGEFALLGKTQLAQAGEAQLTLAWTLAHRHVATGWRRSAAGLTLVATAPLASGWEVHANLGHQRDELGRNGSTLWALAAEHQGLVNDGRWQPMAEVYGDDRSRPWVSAALRFAVMP